MPPIVHAMARERLTVTSGVVVTLTASKYDQSAITLAPNQHGMYKRRGQGAWVYVETGSGDCHYTIDGTTPTIGTTVSAVGITVSARDAFRLNSLEELQKFKIIALTTDAIIEVEYLR